MMAEVPEHDGKKLNKDEIKDIFVKLEQTILEPTVERNYEQFIGNKYNFLYPHRGLVLTILNTYLDESSYVEQEQKLLSLDGKRMGNVLSRNPFDYKHFIKFKDVTNDQMEDIFKYTSELKGLKNCSSFIFHFAGHGSMKSSHDHKKEDQEFVYDINQKSFNIATIADYFSDNKCKGLCGKPKLFFIDACRLDVNELLPVLDTGIFATAKSDDSTSNLARLRSGQSSNKPDEEDLTCSTFCPNNFLFVRSCIKNQTADHKGLISLGMKKAICVYDGNEDVDLMEFLIYASKIVAHDEDKTLEDIGHINYILGKEETHIETCRFLSIQHRLLADIIYCQPE